MNEELGRPGSTDERPPRFRLSGRSIAIAALDLRRSRRRGLGREPLDAGARVAGRRRRRRRAAPPDRGSAGHPHEAGGGRDRRARHHLRAGRWPSVGGDQRPAPRLGPAPVGRPGRGRQGGGQRLVDRGGRSAVRPTRSGGGVPGPAAGSAGGRFQWRGRPRRRHPRPGDRRHGRPHGVPPESRSAARPRCVAPDPRRPAPRGEHRARCTPTAGRGPTPSRCW